MKKLIFIIIAAGLTACGGNRIRLSGAGATFPLPFYNIVFKAYSDKTGVIVNYGGIGSGGGIRSLTDRTVDFAASDAFLSDAEMANIGAEVLHIPTCMGAVVLSYNLPGIDGLKLTGELISDIYLGRITRWNDGKIKALNPDLPLPDRTIIPVYRSDGSGTTFVFTDYLTKVSPEWAREMGAGTSLRWTVGVASRGNPGVAGSVAQTEGAIGYIGSEYALSLNLPIALIQNSAGYFVEANAESISAAANIELPADMRAMVTNSSEPNAYPISCFTWIIVYKNQSYNNRTEQQANALIELLEFILSPEGQETARKVNYAPLPPKALENALNIVKSIEFR